MTGPQLLALYLAVGAIAAGVVARRHEGPWPMRALSALVAWALWPLWAPIALTPPAPRRPRDPRALRLHAALDEALAAARGTALAALLSHDVVVRMRADIERALKRIDRLSQALARPGFAASEARARVTRLAGEGASPRALANAQLHVDGVARLAAARDREHRALEELGCALEALRTQLVLAQLEGAPADDLVAELWARVEGLGAALDASADPIVPEEVASAPGVAHDRPSPEAHA